MGRARKRRIGDFSREKWIAELREEWQIWTDCHGACHGRMTKSERDGWPAPLGFESVYL
jgi:hypothetical protein